MFSVDEDIYSRIGPIVGRNIETNFQVTVKISVSLTQSASRNFINENIHTMYLYSVQHLLMANNWKQFKFFLLKE